MHLLFDKLFPRHILERGYEYYKDDNVRDIYKNGNVYSATVTGTENYHVEVEIEDDNILHMNCNCPYGELDSCKHMAALLYQVQAIDDIQNAEANNSEDTSKEWNEILESIPRNELTSFLTTTMKNDVAFQNHLKSHFSQYFPTDENSYLQEWNHIVSNAEGRSGFIDFHSSYDFENNSLQILGEIEDLVRSQPLTCFHICSSIYYDLAELEIDDSSGCTTTIATKIQEILLEILHCEKADVIEEVQTWLKNSMEDETLQDYCLEEGLDILYVQSFPLPERIELLKDFIICNEEDEYRLHCGNYIDNLVAALEECKLDEDEIYHELLTYQMFTPARNWIIKYLLKKEQVDQAITYIKEGICRDHWDQCNYKKLLIDVYEQYGYDKDYEIEICAYIASGESDAFTFYERYRKQFKEEVWKEKCEQVFSTIKQKELLSKCFYLEHMAERLVDLFKDKGLGFSYLQTYEDLLLEYDSAWVRERYLKECDNLCDEASNYNYEQIYSLLLHLKSLPHGERLAYQKRDDLLVVYRRRSNLVKLLKRI